MPLHSKVFIKTQMESLAPSTANIIGTKPVWLEIYYCEFKLQQCPWLRVIRYLLLIKCIFTNICCLNACCVLIILGDHFVANHGSWHVSSWNKKQVSILYDSSHSHAFLLLLKDRTFKKQSTPLFILVLASLT